MKTGRFCIVVVIIFLVSCKWKNVEERKFTIELPDTSKIHCLDIYYQDINKLSEELNLQKLQNGVDSFELRLWARVETTLGGQVFIIKKINGEWRCLEYDYRETQTGYGPFKYRVDTFWVKRRRPVSTWKNFFSEIKGAHVYNLPSQEDIPGFKTIVTDGITYCVEFATKDKYKFYWYNCPDYYQDDYKECKYMIDILNIFDKEGFNVLDGKRCRKWK